MKRILLGFLLSFLLSNSIWGQGVVLGSATATTNVDHNSQGLAQVYPATATSSGSAISLSVFLDSSNTSQFIWVGIYADSSGVPGTLLAQSEITSPKAGAWNTATISSVAIVSGKRYWLAVLGTGSGSIEYRDTSVASSSCTSYGSSGGLTQLASLWKTTYTWGNCPVSMYASASLGNSIKEILAETISVSDSASTVEAGSGRVATGLSEVLHTLDSIDCMGGCGLHDSLTTVDSLAANVNSNSQHDTATLSESLTTQDSFAKRQDSRWALGENLSTGDQLVLQQVLGDKLAETLTVNDNVGLVWTISYPSACTLVLTGDVLTCSLNGTTP